MAGATDAVMDWTTTTKTRGRATFAGLLALSIVAGILPRQASAQESANEARAKDTETNDAGFARDLGDQDAGAAQATTPPDAAPVITPVTTKPPSIDLAPRPSSDATPTSVWILGGVGALGFASFTYFGLTASSDLRDLRSSCAPDCSTSSRDAAHDKALTADISLGVAVVATTVAIVLYLVHQKHD